MASLIGKVKHAIDDAKDKVVGMTGGKETEEKGANGEGRKTNGLRVRMSIRELMKDENKTKRYAFLRAWQRIKALPPSNPNSFWSIATYHGEPFKPRKHPVPEGTRVWNGWCQHENVLFPTWHRFYLLHLEHALQAVCPGEDVAMAYWDETSEESLNKGIPELLTADPVDIDGKMVRNPLINFTLPRPIQAFQADKFYNKPVNYTTVRYPYSGIKSPLQAEQKANEHNKMTKEYCNENGIPATKLLNDNIIRWLNHGEDGHAVPNGIEWQYQKCLSASTYNAFSNIDSAGHAGEMSLEQPHNSIHLAVGGFDLGGTNIGQLAGANGDMGENETAAFDPIFFLHHCNVDRVFWIWQKKHDKTDTLEIDPADVWGTNGADKDGQGLAPDQYLNQALSMDTPLVPFQDELGLPVTSRDCVNIKNQLDYTYSLGSLEDFDPPTTKSALMKIANIDKNKYPGSFLVRAYYKEGEGPDQKKKFFGQYPVLSRWNKEDCKNCQYHLMVSALFDLTDVPDTIEFKKSPDTYVIEIVWRNPFKGSREKEELEIKKDPGQYDPVMSFLYF